MPRQYRSRRFCLPLAIGASILLFILMLGLILGLVVHRQNKSSGCAGAACAITAVTTQTVTMMMATDTLTTLTTVELVSPVPASTTHTMSSSRPVRGQGPSPSVTEAESSISSKTHSTSIKYSTSTKEHTTSTLHSSVSTSDHVTMMTMSGMTMEMGQPFFEDVSTADITKSEIPKSASPPRTALGQSGGVTNAHQRQATTQPTATPTITGAQSTVTVVYASGVSGLSPIATEDRPSSTSSGQNVTTVGVIFAFGDGSSHTPMPSMPASSAGHRWRCTEGKKLLSVLIWYAVLWVALGILVPFWVAIW